MWMIWITLLFLLGYAGLMGWYRRHFIHWTGNDAQYDQRDPDFTATLIIPARNEAQNLPTLFTGLLEQDYPLEKLQVILVNDHSEDATREIGEEYSGRFPHFEIIDLHHSPGMVSHKKRAIELGVNAANGQIILCTDADCVMKPGWLKAMLQPFTDEAVQFVAGPVRLKGKESMLFHFQQLDFLVMQGITAASVSGRFHYMCNGANLAYRKKAFHAVSGFLGVDALPTGDDMFLMQKMVNHFSEGVIYRKSKEAIVDTEAPATWSAFLQQRIRWASKAAHYEDWKIITVLAWVYFTNLWMLVLFFSAFIRREFALLFVVTLLLKTALEWWFAKPVFRYFNYAANVLSYLLLQPLHILYMVISGFLGRVGKYQWKGRTIEKPSKMLKRQS